jgi:hypothetical protein
MKAYRHEKANKILTSALLLAALAILSLLISGAFSGTPALPTRAARGVQVQPSLAAERIQELQKTDEDILGDLELAQSADPSFESVAGLLPAMKRPREVVGVKHHPHDIGVAADASLELSDDVDAAGSPVAFFEVGTPPVRFGAGEVSCSKSLMNGFLPVVVAVSDYQDCRWRQTIFGWSEKLIPEADLWAYVSLEVQNQGKRALEAAARFRVSPEARLNPAQNWGLKLSPGDSARIYLKVPFDVAHHRFEETTAEEFGHRLNEVTDFWTHELESGMRLITPERRVNEAYKAWKAFASLDVDKRNGILEPHDGAGFYEMIYGYSAALYPHALDLWGRPEDARAILESLLSLQAPDGLFTQNFGTPDPGALLLSLCAHYELTGDGAWLRGLAPRMVKLVDWIVRKRRESMTEPGVQRPVTFGLIKFRPYCDHQDPAYDYFGDTYCSAGLQRAAQALTAVGLTEEGSRVSREAASYRRDILASMEAAVVNLAGLPVLPMEPDTHRLLKDSQGRGGGYYGLIASCMLESEFLPAADRQARRVMDFIQKKGGLRLGMAEFAGGIDHAYTYGYWLNSLKLDRVRPVILGFYGSLAFGMSRGTYSGVEVTRLFTGDNEPTLPHLYSCTQQLRLLRMMLLREEDESLWVGQAVPGHWLGAGEKIEVLDAPTKYGPVSIIIDSHVDRGEILVDGNFPGGRTPKLVFLRLRHPAGKPIAGITIDGKPSRSYAGDTIRLESPRGILRIKALF